MRESIIGLAVMCFVTLYAVYLMAPDLFERWVHRLFFMH